MTDSSSVGSNPASNSPASSIKVPSSPENSTEKKIKSIAKVAIPKCPDQSN